MTLKPKIQHWEEFLSVIARQVAKVIHSQLEIATTSLFLDDY